MSWDRAFQSQRERAARGPVAANPATLGEVWDAQWRAAGLDTVFGLQGPRAEAFDELRGAIESAAGMPVGDLAARQGKPFMAGRPEQALADLVPGLDPAAQEKVRPFLDIDARAREKAAATERRAAEVAERTFGLSGIATGFLAGLARQAVDPVNLATMFVGGPLTGSVPRMLAREAAYGAAVQAAQEPIVQSERAELGLDAGVGRALGNIATAAAGNAALAGLFRAGAYAYRRAFDRPEVAPGEATSRLAGDDAPAFAPVLREQPEAGRATPAPADAPGDAELPPLGEGMVRMWHGGAEQQLDGARWFSSDRSYAEGYSSTGRVAYVDLPFDHPLLDRFNVDEFTNLRRGMTANVELPADIANLRRVAPTSARPTPPTHSTVLTAEDFVAAAHVAERDGLVDALAPDQSSAGKAFNAEATELAAAHFEEAGPDALAAFEARLSELDTRMQATDAAAAARARAQALDAGTAEADIVDVPVRSRRAIVPDPTRMSMARYIASIGGIRKSAETAHLDFDRKFVPGIGAFARKTGKQIDEVQEALVEAGYLPADPVDGVSVDRSNEIWEALRDEFDRGVKRYSIHARRMLEESEGKAQLDEFQQWEREVAAEVETIRAEIGSAHSFSDADLREAAEKLLSRQVGSYVEALERIAMAQELSLDGPPPVLRDLADDLPPGWEWERFDGDAARELATPEDRRGAGAAGDGGSRPGEESRPEAAGREVPDAGEVGGAGGSRAGDPPLDPRDPPDLTGLFAGPGKPELQARFADLTRAFRDAGGDLPVYLDGADKPVSARQLLDDIKADGDAVAALRDCLGQGPQGGGAKGGGA